MLHLAEEQLYKIGWTNFTVKVHQSSLHTNLASVRDCEPIEMNGVINTGVWLVASTCVCLYVGYQNGKSNLYVEVFFLIMSVKDQLGCAPVNFDSGGQKLHGCQGDNNQRN